MKKLMSLLVASTALLSGCDQANTPASSTPATATVAKPAPAVTPAPTVNKADAVAVVNGQTISKAMFEDLIKGMAIQGQDQAFLKEKLLEQLIQQQLLAQDALKKQLDKSPEVISQLDNIKNTLLAQAALQSYLKANPVSDEELKAEYDSKVGGSNAMEYKASHILVKTEEEAKKIIAELDKGGKFAELANKHSLDAKDSQNGGELGWFSSGQMVEPFSDATAKLEKGKYSKEPVKTQFGYHIILKEDTRTQTPPPFEAVKEQLKPILERKKVQAMLETMRKEAKVEVLIPLAEEKAEPAKTEAPAPAAEPAKTEAPAPAAEPAKAEESVKSLEAGKAEEPVPVEQPAKTEVPAPTAEPAKAEQPARHQDTIPVKPSK